MTVRNNVGTWSIWITLASPESSPRIDFMSDVVTPAFENLGLNRWPVSVNNHHRQCDEHNWNCFEHLSNNIILSYVWNIWNESTEYVHLYTDFGQPLIPTSHVQQDIRAAITFNLRLCVFLYLLELTLYCRWVDISTRLLRIREAIKKNLQPKFLDTS